jgi:hypothetical protein
MFLATVNGPRQLLYLSFIGRVSVEELERGREDIVALLAELESGFRLLADLGRLESMDINCSREIGKVMELCGERGVGLVIRIIPDPDKDIGMSILSVFHYQPRPRIVTCKTFAEVEDVLRPGRLDGSDDST